MNFDARDIIICDPTSFRSRWFSYSLRQTARRNEVEASIHGIQIVWIDGSSRPEEMNSVQIFCQDLMRVLDRGGKLYTDDDYP